MLSICIPTYNRAEFLKECLESILLSVKGYDENVEIIISDNASTDGTRKIVEEFKFVYPNLRYHRNTENIGGERNCYVVASLANGKYLWLIGDDDKVAEIAIPTVLNKLKDDINLIICNFSCFSKDFKRITKKQYYKYGAIDCIYDHNLLLGTFGISLGFISSVIIKKDIFFVISKDEYEKYVKYSLIFLIPLYSGIINNCKAAYIGSPLVYNRINSPVATGVFDLTWCDVFVNGSAIILNDLERKGYSSRIIKRAKNKTIFDYIINYIVNAKADGRPFNDVYVSLSDNYRDCWMYWLVCLPLRFVPDIFFKIIKQSYRRLKYRV